MNEFVIKNGFISQGISYVSDGNLGVGVTSPTSRLEVKGIDSSSSNYGLKVQNSGGTNNLVVRNDGNVGIGTSTPSYRLHVKDGTLRVGSNDGMGPNLTFTTGLFVDAGANNNQTNFYVKNDDDGQYFNVTSNGSYGRVGIGIDTNASARLHIVGYDTTSSNYGLKVQNSGGTDNLVVRNDGNVGIGTSTPSEKLDVSGKTKTINFQMTSGVTDGYVLTSDSLGNGTWQLPAPFTGNTSATSVTNLYIKNIYGTSPITIHDSIKSIGSQSTGVTSFAFGGNVSAFGDYSHAEGGGTIAIGNAAHAEGKNTQAIGNFSHAEGAQTISSGSSSHSQGFNTTSIGDSSHASGSGSTASGTTSFVHGSNSVAGGISTIVLGDNITGITNNTTYVNKLNIVLSGTPSSSLDPQGENGSVLWDNNYFYWKANNQWLRISGSTW